MRVQRTRSSAPRRRSPLTRYLLGAMETFMEIHNVVIIVVNLVFLWTIVLWCGAHLLGKKIKRAAVGSVASIGV